MIYGENPDSENVYNLNICKPNECVQVYRGGPCNLLRMRITGN